jgi:hypothetical protein
VTHDRRIGYWWQLRTRNDTANGKFWTLMYIPTRVMRLTHFQMKLLHLIWIARWNVFKPKFQIWVNFLGLAMENVGLFYNHLASLTAIWYIYFRAIWHILWSFAIFFPVLVSWKGILKTDPTFCVCSNQNVENFFGGLLREEKKWMDLRNHEGQS